MDDDGVLILFILIGAVLFLAVVLYGDSASLVNQTQDNRQNTPSVTPYCGDHICNNGETCSICPQDCGSCPPPTPYCGDGICNNGETCLTCPHDCGACQPYCGDGICQTSETCSTCPTDCGACKYKTYMSNGNVNWEFTDTRGNTVNWAMPMDTYKAEIASPKNIQALRLNCTTCTENPFITSDYRSFVQPDFFKNVIYMLTNGRTDRGFVAEAVNLKSQLIVYNVDNIYNESAKWPGETLTDGSGVCRDTAVLMASLLEAGNEQANYGMKIEFIYVDSDHLDEPQNINHIFLRVTFSDGTIRFLETTINDNVDIYSDKAMHYWAFDANANLCQYDLTVYGSCSGINIGYYCDNGSLVPSCSRCGCPTSYPYCKQDDKCYKYWL